MIPHDPFGRSALPASLVDREQRVRWLVEAVGALERGELPDAASMQFMLAGLRAWLSTGGDLCRDFWKVSPPRASTLTPAKIAARLAHRDEGDAPDDRAD